MAKEAWEGMNLLVGNTEEEVAFRAALSGKRQRNIMKQKKVSSSSIDKIITFSTIKALFLFYFLNMYQSSHDDHDFT